MFRTASSLLLRAWLRAAAVIGEAAGAEPKSQPRSTVSCTGVGPRSCSVSPVCSTCVQLPLLQPVHVVLAERPACSGALASLPPLHSGAQAGGAAWGKQDCGLLPSSVRDSRAEGTFSYMFLCRIELLLQSQRPEVEEMIREMGVGQAAVEQLAVYCVSLKK